MRLPLRHPPPRADARPQRCAYLDALAAGLEGVPLGPAAGFTSSSRSRGRHGNALQWHLGLAAHDNIGAPDWEARIEIKLVSVWRRPNGAVGCDKIKVCDANLDPWAKLSNVLWVFADRLTRIVVGCRPFVLAGSPRARLEAAWDADPHFGKPDLFVEAREQVGDGGVPRRAPAYYVAASWFAEAGLLPADAQGVFAFDAGWWKEIRAEHGRDPVVHVATEGAAHRCRRCGGPIAGDPEALATRGFCAGRHGLPWRGSCAVRGHVLVDPAHLLAPRRIAPPDLLTILEERQPPGEIWRLCDHVGEPPDHGH